MIFNLSDPSRVKLRKTFVHAGIAYYGDQLALKNNEPITNRWRDILKVGKNSTTGQHQRLLAKMVELPSSDFNQVLCNFLDNYSDSIENF
jgi:hypothetical protein